MSQIQRLTSDSLATEHVASPKLPHVLLVVDGFPKALGGGERIVLRMAALLPRYGFRASILTFAVHPESEFRASEAPCPVYLLPLTNTYGAEALSGAFALRRLVRNQEIKIVQTFFESSDIWAGLVTRLLSSAKLIWNRRDMGILRSAKHTYAYRALRRFPHAVFAVSRRVAEHTVNTDGVPASRVHVIHNGLDLAPALVKASGAERFSSGRPVITTVGNVRKVKGHDLLVEAAALVTRNFPAAQFTIAGDILEPAYFEALQQRIVTLGLSENVHFVGKVSDTRQHLASASIFILPSRSEGFSNALIEAMAAGLPCIATDVGGNAEAIDDRRSGLIVAPEDVAALADAIEAVLRDPDYAGRLGTAARQAVEEHFTSDAMMGKVANTLKALLQQ